MLEKIKLLYHTTRYLKPTQVLHQIKYRIWKPKPLDRYNKIYISKNVCFLNFRTLPPVYQSYLGKNSFTFLNQNIKFGSSIDWGFQDNGKLWNYNLQYANYLLQEEVSFKDKEQLLNSLYNSLLTAKLSLEPYPVSLRAINVIRLFSVLKIENESLFSSLHAELDFLSKRPEYHLLGNHLLENGFALMMGGAFFSEDHWLKQGKAILIEQLGEQILADGAHFELSLMYHQIIFFRLLELIDWYTTWPSKEDEFEKFVIHKAILMLSWLKNISFENGEIPHFNDSAEGIAYSTKWLANYAGLLAIPLQNVPLGISGYRSKKTEKYECKIDIAQLGPSYQPGHAHADALSFILYHKGKPLFVEKGTSTYQIGKRRSIERATSAHNTVLVNHENQSNVWSGFRVAERAKVHILKDEATQLDAKHDGYRKIGITHKRSFKFKEDEISIEDEVFGNNEVLKEFHLHLAPGLEFEITNNKIDIQHAASIEFDSLLKLNVEEYEMANGYNRYLEGKKIVVSFVKNLNTRIQLK